MGTVLEHDAVAATFADAGEMAERGRRLDWSATPLGPVLAWPAALRAVVRTCLASPFPTNLWCGPSLVLVYNDAYVRVLGDKHPAALGRAGREVWAEIWLDIAPMFAAIERGEGAVYAEDAHFEVERDGHRDEAWFTFSLSAVRDEGGELLAYLNVVSETTGRVRAEQATGEARRRVEAVLASISDAFFALDREWRFTYVNDRAAQLLQRDREALLGRVLWEAFAPAVGTIFETEYRRAAATRVPVTFEAHYPPLDAWYEVRAYPAADGLAVYFQDVTERRRAAEALAASERRFRAVQDASPDASLLAQAVRDADGRIVDFLFTYANAATQAVLMGGPELVVGRTMREAFPESVAAGRLAIYARVVETGEPWQADVYYTRGAVAHGLRATAVKVDDGVHITAVDLSERMRAEAERERLLAEAQRARAEAEGASRIKSEFLATMSHELRTPLNAIGGYADLLLLGVRGELSGAQREDVERVRRSNQHLLSLIDDVLNFARLEAGRVEFRVEPVPVAPLLDGLEDLLRPQLAAKTAASAPGVGSIFTLALPRA